MGERKNEWRGEETNEKKAGRQGVRDKSTVKAALKKFVGLYG